MAIPTPIPSSIPTSEGTVLEGDGMAVSVQVEEGSISATAVAGTDEMVASVLLEEARLFTLLEGDGMVATATMSEPDTTQHANLAPEAMAVNPKLEEAVITQHYTTGVDQMIASVKMGEVGFSVIPARPTGFEAERKNSFNDTELTWDAVSGADEYVISRAEHYRERYVELARVQSGTTTYTDSHGNAGQRYSYRIYAVHLYGGKSTRSPAVHSKGSQSEL